MSGIRECPQEPTCRPILFSGPMVRALLDGRKTQTRRILKPQPYSPASVVSYSAASGCWMSCEPSAATGGTRQMDPWRPIRIRAGDRLWVREKAAVRYTGWHHVDGHTHSVSYAADENDYGQHIATVSCGGGIRRGEAPTVFPPRSHRKDGRLQWCPAIHMPRWASRLTLTVTDVRVQRLQDISNEDCIAEGVPVDPNPCAPRSGPAIDDFARKHRLISHYGGEYLRIWESINGKGSWEANPWVAAYTFTVEQANIDALANRPVCEEA